MSDVITCGTCAQVTIVLVSHVVTEGEREGKCPEVFPFRDITHWLVVTAAVRMKEKTS